MSKLKGVATIQLFNAETGELEQEVKEENMITNAVSNILNPPDYMTTGWDLTIDRAINVRNTCNKIVTKLFNGVLIFNDKIKEDANITMPPWDNYEIGHAGPTTSENYSRLGTYNSTESGELFDSSGTRYGVRRVWDFGTDRANGDISCVCLTSRSGGHTGEWKEPNRSSGGTVFFDDNTGIAPVWGHTGAYCIKMDNVSVDQINIRNDSLLVFYIERATDGNVKMLAKNKNGSSIYEVILKDPFKQGLFSTACTISTKKIFTVGTQKELSWCWADDPKYTSDPNREVGKNELSLLRESQDVLYANYFPYVYKGVIHIIYPLGTRNGNYSIKHIALDVNTYNILDGYPKLIKMNVCPETDWVYNYRWVTRTVNGQETNVIEDYCYWSDSWSRQHSCIFYYDNHYFFRDVGPFFVVVDENGNAVQKEPLTTYDMGFRSVYIDEINDYVIIEDMYNQLSINQGYIHARILKKDKNNYYGHIPITVGAANDAVIPSWTDGAPFIKVKEAYLPFYISGGFYYHSNDNVYYSRFNFGWMYSFLSTINNLATTVRKTNGQTMKITYDIIQLE